MTNGQLSNRDAGAAELIQRTRIDRGLPATIEDRVVLERVAARLAGRPVQEMAPSAEEVRRRAEEVRRDAALRAKRVEARALRDRAEALAELEWFEKWLSRQAPAVRSLALTLDGDYLAQLRQRAGRR